MTGLIAVVREVGDALARCELTHLERAPVDLALAREQHAAYREALASLGCEVVALPGSDEHPDAVFVEDTAVVVDEVAVIARPGAASRRGEVDSVAEVLACHRRIARIEAPAMLDGGDVLVIGRAVYVGQGARTNAAGARALGRILEPLGYGVVPVPVTRCLHLKSAVTALDAHTVLVNPQWIDAARFEGLDRVEVDPTEQGGANALALSGSVIYPGEMRRTRARLEAHGVRVLPVSASEVAKCEGAVTCCSIVFVRGDAAGGNVAV